MKPTLLTILFLVLVLNANAEIIEGTLDLSTYDFQNNPAVSLAGEWRFYFGELYTSRPPSGNEVYIEVPKRWHEAGYESTGYATYALDIIIPSHQPLTLKLPDLLSAGALYINGVLLDTIGSVGTSGERSIPQRRVRYIPIPSQQQDTLHICLQVSNFTHHKGGLGSIPLIGATAVVHRTMLRQNAYDLFLCGCLIMGALFLIGLYASGRREEMTIYFALFCFMYAYRVLGRGNYLLHDLIDLPYRLAISLEYSTLYLSSFFFAIYLKKLFPDETPRILINIAIGVSLSFAMSTLLPVHIFTGLIDYYLWVLMADIVIVGFVFIKAALHKRKGSYLAIYSTFGIFTVIIIRILAFTRIITELQYLSLIGEITFFFCQSLILSKYFVRTWREAQSEAEKIAQSKADFLSIMSHEIRTPLNVLIGTTYHMIDNKPKNNQKQDLYNMKNASETLLHLVNNILDFNKMEQGKLQLELVPVNFHEFIHDQIKIFEPIASKKDIYVRYLLDSNVPKSLKMDKVRVAQIINNLLGNALKFTHTGGVTLEVGCLKITKDHAKLKFTISDTGIGMDHDEMHRIFESFQQANRTISGEYGGSGLGLAITKKLLQVMKSDIFVESSPGNGTSFTFELELSQIKQKTKSLKNQATNDDADFSGRAVLLVDDNSMNVLIARRFLEKWNLEVDTAENGSIAIEKVKAEREKYSLVLMDLQMPVMDGYTAAQNIRTLGYKRPIIALTASTISKKDLASHDGQINDFITKPYQPEELRHKLSNYLL